MIVTKKQMRKLIKEVLEENTAGPPISGEQAISLGGSHGGPSTRGSTGVPAEFTRACTESLELLIGEAQMMGMSFPDAITEIYRVLDDQAEQGW